MPYRFLQIVGNTKRESDPQQCPGMFHFGLFWSITLIEIITRIIISWWTLLNDCSVLLSLSLLPLFSFFSSPLCLIWLYLGSLELLIQLCSLHPYTEFLLSWLFNYDDVFSSLPPQTICILIVNPLSALRTQFQLFLRHLMTGVSWCLLIMEFNILARGPVLEAIFFPSLWPI